MKVRLYNYNNYFNRIVRSEALLANYGSPLVTQTNINFYPGDGVRTTCVLNSFVSNVSGNYLILTDDNDHILSRWFVINSDRNRAGQQILHLLRDCLVDHKAAYQNAPCIIERAMLDKDNPLLFNGEGFTFNQIKKNEILLQDAYKSRWIYLYMAKNAADKTGISVSYQPYANEYDIAVTSIATSIYDGVEHNSYNVKDTTDVLIYARYFGYTLSYSVPGYFKKDFTGKNSAGISSTNWNLYFRLDDILYLDEGTNEWAKSIKKYMNPKVNMNSTLKTALNTDYHNYLTSESETYLTSLQETEISNSINKIIYETSTGKYYKVSDIVIDTKSHEIKNNVNYNFCGVLTSQLSSYFYNNTTPDNATYNAILRYKTYRAVLVPMDNLTFTVSVTPSTKTTTDDSECNIIAIPLEGCKIQTTTEDPGTGDYSVDDITGFDDINLAVARSIAREYTNSVVYDMQILPYSPYPEYEDHAETINVSKMNSKQYQKITYNDYTGYIFYLTTSNFTFDISKTIQIESYTNDEAIDKKLSNECDTYRLCSPNYDGMYEFSVAKNNGVSKFNVDMTLKPYRPYIHINPDFKGLYGEDFNDSRGLILNGDFSLPIIGDAFQDYELRNKNYELIFDRNIQHMDFNNKLSRYEAAFGAVTGTITSGIGGAVSGGLAGGIGGAVAGGTIGSIASGIGGALDYSFLKKRQNENKDLAIDMFKYNLGNIQALPYSLNKVNPLTYNNKKFPFIEYFSCTNEEKDILVNKIIYNSMSVMAVGTINEFIKSNKTFIKGTLIRIDPTNLNYEEIQQIYEELQKGAYF